MPDTAQIIVIASCLVAILIIGWALRAASRSFRLFHFRVNLPIIGLIARLGRLSPPTTQEANRRLDKVFRRYRTWIGDQPMEEAFQRALRYLFLAGDGATHPAKRATMLSYVLFLVAEAALFAFVLGGRVWVDASEDEVKMFAVVITAVVVSLFAFFGQRVGGLLRRRSTLMKAGPHALDPRLEIAGERPLVELTSHVSLNEDQKCDQPRRVSADAQRLLNRGATYPGDKGKIWPIVPYSLFVATIAYLQFHLRAFSNVAASASDALSGDGELSFITAVPANEGDVSFYANVFFVVVFIATQIFAVVQGYRHGFVGIQSADAYKETRGAHDFKERKSAWDEMTHAADESLTNLLNLFERYPNIKPDTALYLQRATRAEAPVPAEDGGDDPSAPASESNVTPLPLGGGGK